MVHEFAAPSGDDLWVQKTTTPAGASGTAVTANDTAPTTDRWNLVAVEVLAATTPAGTTGTPNSVSDGLAASEIVHDDQGNITHLADMDFTYDAAGLHAGTTYADGSTVSVVRDASGRIVKRTVDPAGSAPVVVTTFLFAGDGDVP